MQNAPREHSAILSTFIKLLFVFETFVSSSFEWPLKTGFTVSIMYQLNLQFDKYPLHVCVLKGYGAAHEILALRREFFLLVDLQSPFLSFSGK